MTAGIKLDAVQRLIEYGDRHYHKHGEKGVTSHSDLFPNDLQKGRLATSPKTLGLITLLRLYIARGTGKKSLYSDLYSGRPRQFSYPKKIGDVLLSRSDFASIFELVEENEKRRYRENPEQWIHDVLEIFEPHSDHPFMIRGERLFGRGVSNIESEDERNAYKNITNEKWLTEMIGSFHPKTSKVIPGKDKLHEIPSDARMSLSDICRTEKVGLAQDEKAPILEYRIEQGKRLPIDKIRSWGEERFKLVLGLNGDPNFQKYAYSQLKTN